MSELNSVDQVLDFAIQKEQEAQAFYRDLAGRVGQHPHMVKLFNHYVAMEAGHEAKLKAVKQGKRLMPSAHKVADLKIADYVVDVTHSPGEMDYQDALTLAMQREKAAFRLYADLAESSDDPELKATFETLAQEEAVHKLQIETEYDEQILREN